jgi:hypothetical protein
LWCLDEGAAQAKVAGLLLVGASEADHFHFGGEKGAINMAGDVEADSVDAVVTR